MVVPNPANLLAVTAGVLFLILFRVSVAHDPVSHETLEILRHIEGSINHNIDPCDDFFEYACGNFKNLPNESVSTAIITWATENFDATVGNIIAQEIPTQKQKQTVTDKARIFYQSCKNLHKWELLNYLDEVRPAPGLDWPLVLEMFEGDNDAHTWPSQKFDVLEFVALLSNYDVNIFFKYGYLLSTKGIAVWTPEPEELQPKEVDDILNQFILPNDNLARYRNEILQVHAQWQSIYKSFEVNQEFHLLRYSKLKQLHPEFATYLNKSMPADVFGVADFPINIFDMRFVQFLMAKQWHPSEKRKLCNYLMIKYLLHVKNNHKQTCASDLRTKMSFAANYIYYENNYLPNAQEFNEKISQLVKNVYGSLWEVVTENRMGFNDTQMDYLKTRVRSTYVNIGNMPENVNLTTVEEFYSDLAAMDVNNFYKNDLMLLRMKRIVSYTSNEIQPWSYFKDDDIQPYNEILETKVIVPFASTNFPTYHHKMDDLFSLSGLGFYLGHEFSHSIDPDAWKHSGTLLFAENQQARTAHDCLMQQKPTNDMIERISDLVGFRVAYNTYSRTKNVQPNFTSIPWQQLFFLNVAQTFCSKVPDNPKGHDPGDIRVREIAMNSEEFASAFQCPLGSRMNPVHKCHFF